MWRKLRSAAVMIAVILGLIAQGMGMPAVTAGVASAAQAECPTAHGKCSGCKCSGSGMAQHPGMQACQPPCVTPGTLPGPSAAAAPVVWTPHQFAASASGLPPGLNPAPDPFPPRSPALA